MDDYWVYNSNFKEKYNLIFSSRTLYYLAPEIGKVIENTKLYLSKKNEGGTFTFVYN